MLTDKTLELYSDLIVKIGVNLQKNQGLEIICPIEKSDFAHALMRAGYRAGASIVRVRWQDDEGDKISFENASISALSEVPKWFVDRRNYLVKNNFCYIAVSAEDPSVFKDIPSEKISAVAKAKSKALKKFSDAVMSNSIRWCVVSAPTLAWAKQVFPDSLDPINDLALALEKTMRLDNDNPVKAWEEHIELLEKRANFLNDKNFEYLHFTSSSGTNLKVGLSINHQWISAREKAKDGVYFVANMPTEEVFTAPHKNKVDGVLYSALPLAENGKIIDEFKITFNKGKIVDFSAKKGYDDLKNIINTDKGTFRLGEVALIGKNSPIAKLKTLFFNTLFDENASCHLAIGKGYPSTIKDGDKLSEKELISLGLNDSTEHVDFMIGTPDMKIVGIDFDGNETLIFENGDWII